MKRALALMVVLVLAAVAPGQDFAVKRLEKSPRHQEWVKVPQGGRTVDCFIMYPESKEKTPAVIVIHEIFGLSDWVRSVVDQLAEAGFIAIAPDLLSGMGPKGGGSKEIDAMAVTKAVSGLKPEQVTADLNAVADYVVKLPACNGKLAVSGFCWGGGQTFRFATDRKDLKAAFVFYGSFGQNNENLAKIPCPVYGFYGENDMRINATIPESEKLMTGLGKTYEPVIYPGAGHGFMRSGEDPAGKSDDRKGRDAAWERWKTILKKI
jgi:carboxymethylenebutenolidase